MTFDLTMFWTLTRGLACIAVLVSSFEYMALRKELSRVSGRFSSSFFLVLVLIQALSAGVYLLNPMVFSFAPIFMFASTLLISVHFGGSFNGGSDSMILVVLTGLSVHSFASSYALIDQAALIYVAVQSVLSYVIAGFIKIKRAGWRSGLTLKHYIQNSEYHVPFYVHRIFDQPYVALVAAWGVMLFELALIPALFYPQALFVWMVIGLNFHLANFATLGINRFVFAWIATYPALWYLCALLSLK